MVAMIESLKMCYAQYTRGKGHHLQFTRKVDIHGNTKAEEGCDRCPCGCKYWENDVCVSCGEPFREDDKS